MLQSYLPVIVFAGLGILVGGAFALLNSITGPRRPNPIKGQPYECGLPSHITRTFRFERFPMLEGVYYLTVAVSDHTQVRPFDHWEKAVRFEVDQSGIYDVGSVVVDGTWTAEGRTSVARNETRRVQAGATVELALHQQHSHHRLRAGYEDTLLAEVEQPGKGDFDNGADPYLRMTGWISPG